MIEIIQPKNEQEWLDLRCKDITSTDVGALFGISPYTTAYELWHRKKDAINVSLEDNDRMFWGRKLQDAIASAVAEKNGWMVRRMDEYMRDTETRLGSSFDFSIDPAVCTQGAAYWGDGILEVKNVDYIQFKKEWIVREDGSIEAPLHIEIQAQHQLLVSGKQYLWLAALVGGNDLKLIKRTPDQKIFSAITAKAWDFWQSIEDNKPPAPDFANDADFIAKMYNFAEPGKIIDISEDTRIKELVMVYKIAKEIVKDNDSKCEAAKAEILTLIGNAEKCIAPMFSISACMEGPADAGFAREAAMAS